MKHKCIIFLSLILLLTAACSGETPAPVDEPTIEVVNLQITPALSHWLPKVAACADDIPDFGIYTRVLPRAELNLDDADLILRLGQRLDTDPQLAIMGIEAMTVIAGSKVPLSSLSIESLQAIFAGAINNWGAVPEIGEAGIEVNQPILTLSYPDGHELQLLFRESYLDAQPITSDPQIFSTLDYLETLLQKNPTAVGYLLESQVPESMQTLAITNFDPLAGQQYVLAITQQEPQGGLRQLLLCLQDSQ